MLNNNINLIKSRIDIVELISDYVRLRRAGRNYLGLCPFHNEKTPSFTVSQERQSWHCFGCGRGGDIFTFIMQHENMDFHEALKFLADRAGVELNNFNNNNLNKANNKANLYEIMSLASRYFENNLKADNLAKSYLERRNLTLEQAAKFNLGWSYRSWDGLLNFLKRNNISEAQALSAGLIIAHESGKFYDRFRGRLIFPVKDISGRVIAFGGRLVDGEGAKYINSPEGEIYSKRDNLYLINQAKNFMKERGRAILCEGYMDAVRLHLSGFNEAVASLGTSLTEEQARLIKRFCGMCYICYDSDEAGQEAALRGMYILQSCGLDVRVININNSKDPDELLLTQNGLNLFNQALASARPLVLYHLQSVKDRYLNDVNKRRYGINNLLNGLAQLDFMDIEPYLYNLTGALNISPETLRHEIKARKASQRPRKGLAKASQVQQVNNNNLNKLDDLECALCALLWQSEDLRRGLNASRSQASQSLNSLENLLELVDDNEVIQDIIFSILMDGPEICNENWLSLDQADYLAIIAKGQAYLNNNAHTEHIFNQLCADLRARKLKARFEALKLKLNDGSATPEDLRDYAAAARNIKS